LAEISSAAVFLAALGALIALSVLFSRTADRLGVPIVLLFLLLGMLGGREGIGRINLQDHHFAVMAGTIYLVLILFDGGMATRLSAMRRTILPAGLLATVGVGLTALLIGIFGRLLGLTWTQSLLLGAVVSSTDAAAVLSVLRAGGLHLQPRVGQVLEVESCINDPMAVILTVMMLDVFRDPASVTWTALLAVPIQLGVGAVAGAFVGFGGRAALAKFPPTTLGLYPAMTVALAFASFALATLAGGSGFLSAFVTGLVLGNWGIPYHKLVSRVHDALAWLSQIGIFVMLGLLVSPSQLLPVAGMGLAVGVFLAVVARPLAVLVCLLPFGYRAREIGYIGWVGLRGAVPIILAAFPVLDGFPNAQRLFHMVFFIVVLSAILPGATIRPVTRWLRLGTPDQPSPSAVLEISSSHPLSGEITVFFVEPSLVVCDASLADIDFPPGSAVVLIVRGEELIAPRGPTVLQENDEVHVFFRPEDRPYIELLFGRPDTV
jgi:cell volume regulation protein A